MSETKNLFVIKEINGQYLFFQVVNPHVGLGAQHKRRMKMGPSFGDFDGGRWDGVQAESSNWR